MTEECVAYPAGPADGAEPPLTSAALVTQAHTHRQGIPYETGEPWLQRLPERLHALADYVPSDQAPTGEVAQAVAALSDRIESGRADPMTIHGFTLPPTAPLHGPPETARPRTSGLAKPLPLEAG